MPIIATPTLYQNPTTVNPATGEGLGGLGPGGIVTPEAIRMFLQDLPENNILSGGQIEFTEKKIQSAIMAACSEYNTIAPLSSMLKLDGSNWPAGCPHLLILGASAWLLKGEASKQIRNQFNAQDGNVPAVGVHDKFGPFLQFAQTLQQEYRDGVSHWKQLQDLESAYSTSLSPLIRRGGRRY